MSCDEQSAKVISIMERLDNTLTKPILLFLAHVLPSMDKFNRLFQKSTANTTCELYSEMSKLVRLYVANVLRTDVIIAASDNLHNLNMDPESQLADENLGIGQATWEHLAELQLEHDLKPFFVGVRSVDLAAIKKMLQKFPFRDSLLKRTWECFSRIRHLHTQSPQYYI